jgi:hypothetical protein
MQDCRWTVTVTSRGRTVYNSLNGKHGTQLCAHHSQPQAEGPAVCSLQAEGPAVCAEQPQGDPPA